MKKKTLIISIALPAIVFASIIYQTIDNKSTKSPTGTPTTAAITKNDETIITHYDFPVASNLGEMTREAQFVVIGEYKNFDSKWNMLRDPNNVELEAKDSYMEGHLYNFEVNEILKGDLKDTSILVNHKYSTRMVYEENNEIINNEGLVVKEATSSKEYNFDNKDFLYIEPDIGSKYILFLNVDSDFGNYYGAIEPFSIKLDKNDTATLQSNLIGNSATSTKSFKTDKKNVNIVNETEGYIVDSISGTSLDQLINEITTEK
ncbi:cardiolipin synthase [Paenibacillus sp. FA6]|uniref:cardiolipin synthase n=1 Tax=Paenibacillus sp. FA6 TaxID=3413029 RepID=UPI003F655BE2